MPHKFEYCQNEVSYSFFIRYSYDGTLHLNNYLHTHSHLFYSFLSSQPTPNDDSDFEGFLSSLMRSNLFRSSLRREFHHYDPDGAPAGQSTDQYSSSSLRPSLLQKLSSQSTSLSVTPSTPRNCSLLSANRVEHASSICNVSPGRPRVTDQRISSNSRFPIGSTRDTSRLCQNIDSDSDDDDCIVVSVSRGCSDVDSPKRKLFGSTFGGSKTASMRTNNFSSVPSSMLTRKDASDHCSGTTSFLSKSCSSSSKIQEGQKMNNFDLHVSSADIFEVITSLARGDDLTTSTPRIVSMYQKACPSDKSSKLPLRIKPFKMEISVCFFISISEIFQETIKALQEVLHKAGLESLSKITGIKANGGKKSLATHIVRKLFPLKNFGNVPKYHHSNNFRHDSENVPSPRGKHIHHEKRKVMSPFDTYKQRSSMFHSNTIQRRRIPNCLPRIDKSTTYRPIDMYKFCENVGFDQLSGMVTSGESLLLQSLLLFELLKLTHSSAPFVVCEDLCCDKSVFRKLMSLRLDELVNLSSDNVPFDRQVLVILRQTKKSSSSSAFPDHEEIYEVIGIARNSIMNAYCVSRLDICLHFSASFAQFFIICMRLIEMQGSNQATITYIPSNLHTYCSEDSRTMVMNHVDGVENLQLKETSEHLESAMRCGLLKWMRCTEKGRSGTSSRMSSPVIHTGFTNSNCAEYSSHRQSQIGHVNPSLVQSYLQHSSTQCKQEYGKAVALLNCLFSESPDAFGIGKLDSKSSYVSKMNDEYCRFFGLNRLQQLREEYCDLLKNTATTALFNNHIDSHVDALNDPSEGNCAVLCFSMMIDRDVYDRDIPQTATRWLDHYGYTKKIPFCQINYSRKVCRQAATRPETQFLRRADIDSDLYNLKTAISDAVQDTESITNYASTFERLLGIEFQDVCNAIDDFSTCQFKIHEKIAKGSWRHVYRECIRSMGEGVRANIDDVSAQMVSQRVATQYDWKNDCHSNLFGKNYVPLSMDPAATYQGPKISLTASYDINRYHSLNIDAYRDIHTNIGLNNAKNKLAFVIFASVQCNSTLPVAELVRILALNDWEIKHDFYGRRYSESFWDLIADVSEHFKFKAIGSSREQRFQISTRGELFCFEEYAHQILERFNKFVGIRDSSEMLDVYNDTLNWLKYDVRNMGHILSIKLLQLSALVGLIPLEVSTYACVDGGGPGKLIKIFRDDSNDVFEKLHSEFSEVWGNKFTKAYLENMLCELHRELQASTSQKKPSIDDVKVLHCVDGEYVKKRSRKVDHIVLYSHRGLENAISNLYRTTLDSRGEWQIEVQAFEIDFHSTEVKKKGLLVVKDVHDMCLDQLYYRS